LTDDRPQLLRASLIGGAVGDSLGTEIEFWSLSQIRDRFPDGLMDLPPHDGIVGAITDDTQMTLFTAEGILDAYRRGIDRGIWHPPSSVHHALLRWLETQGHPSRRAGTHPGLITDRRLHARRAPGLTCLSALRADVQIGEAARNTSKGCGTIMRVAPVALMLPRDMVRGTAIECSALTHGHPTGQRAAAAWAEMLRDVAEGSDLATAAEDILQRYATGSMERRHQPSGAPCMRCGTGDPNPWKPLAAAGSQKRRSLSRFMPVSPGKVSRARCASPSRTAATATAQARLLATCWGCCIRNRSSVIVGRLRLNAGASSICWSRLMSGSFDNRDHPDWLDLLADDPGKTSLEVECSRMWWAA